MGDAWCIPYADRAGTCLNNMDPSTYRPHGGGFSHPRRTPSLKPVAPEAIRDSCKVLSVTRIGTLGIAEIPVQLSHPSYLVNLRRSEAFRKASDTLIIDPLQNL